MKDNIETATLGGQTSPAYIAPEIIKNERGTAKVDMWALGIILYKLAGSLKHPF
jgi:serine/threonine protein kinase